MKLTNKSYSCDFHQNVHLKPFLTCYRCGCTSSLQGSIICLLPLQSADTFDMLHFALFLCAYCFNFYSIGYIRALKFTWLGSRKGCSLAAKAIFFKSFYPS